MKHLKELMLDIFGSIPHRKKGVQQTSVIPKGHIMVNVAIFNELYSFTFAYHTATTFKRKLLKEYQRIRSENHASYYESSYATGLMVHHHGRYNMITYRYGRSARPQQIIMFLQAMLKVVDDTTYAYMLRPFSKLATRLNAIVETDGNRFITLEDTTGGDYEGIRTVAMEFMDESNKPLSRYRVYYNEEYYIALAISVKAFLLGTQHERYSRYCDLTAFKIPMKYKDDVINFFSSLEPKAKLVQVTHQVGFMEQQRSSMFVGEQVVGESYLEFDKNIVYRDEPVITQPHRSPGMSYLSAQ